METPRSTLHVLRQLLGRGRDESGLAAFLQLSEDAVLVIDTTTGQIAEANSRASELTGYPLADLRELPIGDLFTQTALHTLIEQLEPGESRAFRNVTLRSRNGRSPVRVDVRLTLLADNGPVLLVARDLTAARRLEQALARADEQFASIAALIALATGPLLSPDDDLKRALTLIAAACSVDAVALYQHDEGQPRAATDDVPLSCAVGLTTLLPATCEFTGDETAPGLPTISPDRPSSAYRRPSASWSEALRNAGWSAWQTLPLTDGCILLARRSHGAEVASAALLSVVHHAIAGILARADCDHARAEHRPAHDNMTALSRTVLDEMSEGVLILDADGLIHDCNRVAARLLGYETQELLGQPVSDMLVARQDLSDLLACTLGGTSSGARLEVTLLSRDARESPALIGGAPLRGPGSGAVILIQDLSDRRAIEDQHRDLDRLAFLGEMSAIFAHEIRNPLAAISTGVQYVAGKLSPGDPLQDSIALILAESRRLNQLLADILIVARATEPRLAPCDLPAVLDDVLARRAAETERLGIEVLRDYAADLSPCLADRPKLEQVFTNLIANAIQAMPHGGTLSISVKRLSESALQAEVADTGPGIPETVQRRIFDPFFTTRRTGTGLGLTIAKRIVGQHNGSLSLRSWEGVGTIFTVTLPAAISG
jgi:PAS domain S-box-containing protein